MFAAKAADILCDRAHSLRFPRILNNWGRIRLAESALQRIVESLSQDLEEKIYQLSQVRQVAETLSRGIHESQYFVQLCTDFVSIFDAAVCCLFWERQRPPRGWHLDAWAAAQDGVKPSGGAIPEDDEGIFGWLKRLQKPHYLEDAGDEAFVKLWREGLPAKVAVAVIPIRTEQPLSGMLVIIDPTIKLTARNTQLQLEILSRLVGSGIRNRLLYKNLQDSEEEFRDLFENSSDIVVVAYPDGTVKEGNTAFRQKLGLAGSGAGLALCELVRDEPAGVFAECWSKLSRGQEVHNLALNLKRADGTFLEAELSGNARMTRAGEPGLIRLYIRDVTERQEAVRRQRELELELELMRERQLAQVGLYVSGIAHNLQNPVQVLLGYIELLKFKGVKIPELNIIEQSTQTIMNIIRNLLDKMQKERNPNTTLVDLNELLESELTFLNANSYYRHEVVKKFHFAESLPKVSGVYSDFSQALMNIVYNALDAMRESTVKELRVRTAYDRERHCIVVSISDTGIGIPPELREEIFKPFFSTKRGKTATDTGLTGGSGLGLSSAVALLKPYNGTITFESSPGGGSTFVVTIPVT